jgi:regulator of protease activity HflC (stomatin/prohibitin superfamily)
MIRKKRLYLAAALAALVVVIITVSSVMGSFDRTDGGQVAVVRNGGPFDNSNIRQIIEPASSLTWTGFDSSSHKYPAQQRFYTITATANAGDRPGVDVVSTPSSDGVDMGIEGTLYFTLNLDQKTLRSFDDKFGTRTFTGADGHPHHAYDGDVGWSAFLDQIIRPVIDNDLREQISRFRCAELVSSCSLVQNSGSAAAAKATGQSSNGNIAAVQNAINSSLAQDLKSTLGDNFLQGLRFNLVRISLPANVQSAVNKAQAAFAAVSEAQARVAQAKADAAANEARQQGYQKCPACAVIDEMKAIPPSVTTFAPGQNFAVTPPGK